MRKLLFVIASCLIFSIAGCDERMYGTVSYIGVVPVGVAVNQLETGSDKEHQVVIVVDKQDSSRVTGLVVMKFIPDDPTLSEHTIQIVSDGMLQPEAALATFKPGDRASFSLVNYSSDRTFDSVMISNIRKEKTER
jgi:hypothetical protein